MNGIYTPSRAVETIMDGVAWPDRKQQVDAVSLRRSMLEAQAALIRYYLPQMSQECVERADRTLAWLRQELAPRAVPGP